MTGRRTTSRFIACAALAWLLAASAPASALVVQETLWGFDGKVVPDRMNVLSVLVVNESAATFSGTLRLERATRVGAPQEQEVTVSPRGARWVQFYTLNGEDGEEWTLSWGRGPRDSQTLPTPELGAPARVFLTGAGDLLGRRVRIRTFPEETFPVTVAATDGLAEAALDHVPRWEVARREAFMDWLRRGGTVHLLNGSDGRRLAFTAEMSPLNQDAARFRVGAGLVVRHAFGREELTEDALRRAGFPGLALYRDREYWGLSHIEQSFVREMAVFTRPHHSWGLIYLLIIVYIGLIGPVNYLLGRRWRDWRRTTLLYLALVVVTCLAFGYLGRRGHGESAAAHTLAYARSVGPHEWDVTHWVNAFVTSGGLYTASYDSAHDLFAPIAEHESVRGVVRNGPKGTFTADMPLFSSRAWMHRARMSGPDLGLRLRSLPGNGRDGKLRIGYGPDFPKDIVKAYAVTGGWLYTLSWADGELTAAPSDSQALDEGLSVKQNSPFHGDDDSDAANPIDPADVYARMARPLAGYALGGARGFLYRFISVSDKSADTEPQVSNGTTEPPMPVDPEAVHVFVLAKMPPSFGLMRNPFGGETGYVLYHVVLLRHDLRAD